MDQSQEYSYRRIDGPGSITCPVITKVIAALITLVSSNLRLLWILLLMFHLNSLNCHPSFYVTTPRPLYCYLHKLADFGDYNCTNANTTHYEALSNSSYGCGNTSCPNLILSCQSPCPDLALTHMLNSDHREMNQYGTLDCWYKGDIPLIMLFSLNLTVLISECVLQFFQLCCTPFIYKEMFNLEKWGSSPPDTKAFALFLSAHSVWFLVVNLIRPQNLFRYALYTAKDNTSVHLNVCKHQNDNRRCRNSLWLIDLFLLEIPFVICTTLAVMLFPSPLTYVCVFLAIFQVMNRMSLLLPTGTASNDLQMQPGRLN